MRIMTQFVREETVVPHVVFRYGLSPVWSSSFLIFDVDAYILLILHITIEGSSYLLAWRCSLPWKIKLFDILRHRMVSGPIGKAAQRFPCLVGSSDHCKVFCKPNKCSGISWQLYNRWHPGAEFNESVAEDDKLRKHNDLVSYIMDW